jgi:hypothetical protein
MNVVKVCKYSLILECKGSTNFENGLGLMKKDQGNHIKIFRNTIFTSSSNNTTVRQGSLTTSVE